MSMPIRQKVEVAGFRLGWGAVRRLPAPVAYRLFDQIASVTYRRGGKDVDRMRSNYARIRPELTPQALEELVAAGLRSYMRYWCDSFRLPDRSAQDLTAQVRVVGDGAPRAALESGQGIVCFLGHLGNWDTVGAWATYHLAPVTTVAERLEPAEIYDQFVAYREALGMTILPLTGDKPPFPTLVRTVHAGGLVPLLADRDLTASGVDVTLCGHPARMAGGPAALALATGAPLHPVTVIYEPDTAAVPSSSRRKIAHSVKRSGRRATRANPATYRVVMTFGPAVPVPPEGTRAQRIITMTQGCADYLGQTLRDHTEDWHMMQRVFVADGIR